VVTPFNLQKISQKQIFTSLKVRQTEVFGLPFEKLLKERNIYPERERLA
jgi:hypothetical protein